LNGKACGFDIELATFSHDKNTIDTIWQEKFHVPVQDNQQDTSQGICGFIDGNFGNISLHDLMTPDMFYNLIDTRDFVKLARRLQRSIETPVNTNPVEYFATWGVRA
jgi:hypothetical protein